MTDNQELVALLIDGDNISAKYIEKIIQVVTSCGKIIIKKVFVNTTSTGQWEKIISKHSLVAVWVPNNTPKKNSVDIALVVEAMVLLYERDDLTGFFIVSNDADFTSLAKQIRTQNKNVWGIGLSTTPEAFQNACIKFFHLDDTASVSSEVAIDTVKEEPEEITDDAFFELLEDAYQRTIQQGIKDEQGRVTLREIWEANSALFPVEFQQIHRFAGKVRSLAEVQPRIELVDIPDSKPKAHYLFIIPEELYELREAYNRVSEKTPSSEDGWVLFAGLGQEWKPKPLVIDDILYKQPKKIIEKMMERYPEIIDLHDGPPLRIRMKR